jgi:hypothetical protein
MQVNSTLQKYNRSIEIRASNVSFQVLGNNFQIGKAEKCIGDVWLMTNTILLFSNVPRILWDEAWIHVGYVKRHLPTTANEGFKSPIHMITGERAKLDIYCRLVACYILPTTNIKYLIRSLIQEHKRLSMLNTDMQKVANV